MRAQSRVIDALHCLVLAEQFDNTSRILAMNTHACVQRAHTAQREEAVERSAGDAETVGPPCQLLDKRRIGRDHSATDNVAVTIEIFGGRVNDEISSKVERPLERGREKGIVDGDDRAGVVPRGDQAGKVRKSQQRVTRRFDPEQLRSARCNRLRGCFAGKIDELNVEMSLRCKRTQKSMRSTVTVVSSEN